MWTANNNRLNFQNQNLQDIASVDLHQGDAAMAEAIPESISQSMDKRLDHNDICHLAQAFEACTVQQWEKFAWLSLKLPPEAVPNISEDCRERSTKINTMFRKWLEIAAERATYGKIIQIFDEAKLVGIKQRWFAMYRDENKEKIEEYFEKHRDKIVELCHKNISDEDWNSCLRNLRIDDMVREIDAKRDDALSLKKMRILFMYGDRFGFGREATNRLLEAFEGLKDQRSTRQHSNGGDLFFERLRTASIRRCQGCRGSINESSRMVIKHWELITYKERNGPVVTKHANGHYHYDERCVRDNHPSFRMADVVPLRH